MPIKVTDIQHLVRISGRDHDGKLIQEYIKVMETLSNGLDMASYGEKTNLVKPKFQYVTDITWTKGLIKSTALNGNVSDRAGICYTGRTATIDGRKIDNYYHDPIAWPRIGSECNL